MVSYLFTSHAMFQDRFKDVQVGSRWFSTLYILSPNFHRSRVSAPRLFCLAPPGHLVKFWPCAVVSRMTRSGLGTQAALSLRLIAAFGYTIPNCGVLFLFLGLPVFFVSALFVCFGCWFFSWSLFSVSCHGMVPSIHAQRTK